MPVAPDRPAVSAQTPFSVNVTLFQVSPLGIVGKRVLNYETSEHNARNLLLVAFTGNIPSLRNIIKPADLSALYGHYIIIPPPRPAHPSHCRTDTEQNRGADTGRMNRQEVAPNRKVSEECV
jgi:hypothetical protein